MRQPSSLARTLLLALFLTTADSVATGFTSTGSLSVGRRGHTTTMLLNGQVLVTGGIGGPFQTFLGSAELYDPVTGTFTMTGRMNVERERHTATLLPSGKVLIAGGYSGTYLNSAELYDPATGHFTSTGNLNVGRTYHTATLLDNGKALIVGGVGSSVGDVYLASAELYDPTTGSFTSTGTLKVKRTFHRAVRLPDGKVLVAGGFRGISTSSAEIYDPVLGTFTSTGNLVSARQNHTMTMLPGGNVLVAGGALFLDSPDPLDSVELYDPRAGTFTSAGGLKVVRGTHTATRLPSGNVLLAGANADGSSADGAEIFDPSLGDFTNAGKTQPYFGETATLLANGKILGVGSYPDTSRAELYDEGPGCASNAISACLNGSRFRVSVEWTNPYDGGSTGVGRIVPLTGDTGAVWFFDPSNIDLAVKVLDGRSTNGKFWVFYGALSDVGYTITVTDTSTGAAKTYTNPPLTLGSVGDLTAF